MKPVRIFQIVGLLVLVLYLFLLHRINPTTISLPFLTFLPVVWVLVIALVLGFLLGWLSLAGRTFRLQRENRKMRQTLVRVGLEVEPMTPKPEERRSRIWGRRKKDTDLPVDETTVEKPPTPLEPPRS